MPRKFTLPTLFFLLLLTQSYAQDPSFSQFYANRVYLNPALTGIDGGLSFSGIYRLQWKNVDTGFETYSAAVEFHEPVLRSSFGLTVFKDVEGLMQLKTNSIGLSYAYMIPVSDRHNVHIGMQASWTQRSVDWSKIVFSDQLDPVFGVVRPSSAISGLESTSFTDFNIGAVWRFDHDLNLGARTFRDVRTSIGLSLSHASNIFGGTSVDESFQGLESSTPPRLTIHAGSIIPAIVIGNGKNKIMFSPNIKYDIQGEQLLNPRQNFQVLTYGAYALFGGVYVGALYQNKFLIAGTRHTNAMILSFGAYIDSGKRDAHKLFVGFSYDANVTGVGTPAGGVYELAFRWTLNNGPALFARQGRTKSKPLDCYNFY